MPSEYPILDNRPIDQWKVVELKEELKRRKLPTRGLKDDLIKRLDEAIRNENESTDENVENRIDGAPEAEVSSEDATIGLIVAETTMDAMDQGDDGNKLLDNHIIHPEDARTESIVAETTRDIEDPRDGGNKLSDDHTIHPEDAKTDPIVAETAKAMEDPGDEGNKSSDDHITHSENARSESIVLETTKDIDGPGDEGNKLFADNITHSEDAKTKPIVTETTKSTIDEGDKGSKLLDNVIAHSEDGRAVSFVSETTEDMVHQSDNGSKLLDNDTSPFDIDDGMNLLGKESVLEAQLIGDSDPAGVAKEQVVQVSASVVSEVSLNEENIQKVEIQREPQMENEVLKFQHKDAELNSSDHNQVSEVSPVLGLQVKSDSISSDSLSINEKNELKDIVIADVDKLELDVKPEMVIPGPSSVISNSGLHSMDVEEPYVNKESVVKRADEIAENTESGRKSNNGDAGSPERLNLDRSSGDDSMEEDVSESKQTDLKFSSNEVGDSGGKTEVQMSKQEPLVGVTGDDLPDDNGIVIDDTKNVPASSSVKRKPHDNEEVGKTETAKRQRRWNSEGFKLPEVQSTKVASSTTPKDAFNPSLKQNTSKIDPTAIDETPKEREVPPSSRPSTNSLKIDRFLRPFTLKAVQELLGKTGSVISFWMDTIKTHCYVTYSSVEEAVNTRNAVYNLQWPPNGGKLLVAEFVDPQEVKMRAEPPPPQTPAAPPLPAAPRTLPPQPSPRQQPQRHLLPSSPPLPPPPLVSNPLQVRERISLPPPPPLPEKLDPPIVTLDDIFRKTRATPRIYYLPLSEEQVAAKLKTSKLFAGIACRKELQITLYTSWCWRNRFVDGLRFSRGQLWVEKGIV